MNKRATFIPGVSLFLAVLIIVSMYGCQYDYTSPLPGILSIKLRSKSNNIDFSPLNNFVLRFSLIEAVRSDGARAKIYEDTKAVGENSQNPNPTYAYNALDSHARDSSIIVGEAYLPPGDYIGVNMNVVPSDTVVLDGYRFIPVRNGASPGSPLSVLLLFRSPFSIQEGLTTRLVVTIDLDNALLKGANNYYFYATAPYALFTEDFDTLNAGTTSVMGSLPLGWTRSINSDDPASGAWGVRNEENSNGYSGASAGNNCYTSYVQPSGSWIQTPQVSVAGMDYVGVRFGVRLSPGEIVSLQYSTDGSTFLQVPDGVVNYPGTPTWALRDLRLPPLGGSHIQFRWIATGNNQPSEARIDDATVVGYKYSYYISSIQ